MIIAVGPLRKLLEILKDSREDFDCTAVFAARNILILGYIGTPKMISIPLTPPAVTAMSIKVGFFWIPR